MGIFAERLKVEIAGYERNSITVSLGGQETTLYAKPLTGADLDQLMRKHPKFAEAPTLAATADLLIAKCETESGDKAFDMEDKPFLLRVDLSKINQIRAVLFPDQQLDISDGSITEEMGN